jgi:hypothetical protein
MSERTKVTEWPEVRANINPQTLERIEAAREERALSVAALIREALDRAYRHKAL